MIYADNVLTTVAASVTTTDTVISVNAVASPFNAPPDPAGGLATLVLVDSLTLPTKTERITYSGRSGTGPYLLTGVTRTNPQAWPVGSKIFQSVGATDMLSEALPSKSLPTGTDIVAIQDSQASFTHKKATLEGIYNYLQPLVSGLISNAIIANGGSGGTGGGVVFDLSMLTSSSLLPEKMHTSVIPKVADFPTNTPSDHAIPAMVVRMEDNTLRGWGSTFKGMLGINYKVTEKLVALACHPVFNVPLAATEYVIDHVMVQSSIWVLTNEGHVYSAGENAHGQLGHGTLVDKTVLTRIEHFVSNGIFVTKIFASGSASTDPAAATFAMSSFWALDASGRGYACGYNAFGQLSIGNTTSVSVPTLCLKAGATTLQGIQHIYTTGTQHNNVMFRVTDGAIMNGLYAAGANTSNCLGVTGTNISSATRVGTLTNVIDVAMTGNDAVTERAYALILTSTGTGNGDVLSCGYNVEGQLGSTDTNNRTLFAAVSGIVNANIVKIGCAGGAKGFSWAYSGTGILYTWGSNVTGACGNNSGTPKTTATAVFGWSDNTVQAPPFEGKIVKVVTHHHSDANQAVVVLDNLGRLWFTGKDTCFFTDDVGTTIRKLFTPIPLPPLEEYGEIITDIMLHGFNAEFRLFAISSKKRLYAIGENSYGLCTGGVNGTNSATPSYVKSLTRVRL